MEYRRIKDEKVRSDFPNAIPMCEILQISSGFYIMMETLEISQLGFMF